MELMTRRYSYWFFICLCALVVTEVYVPRRCSS